MRTFTKDERALLIGAIMSAGVAGIGIYELLIALSAPEMSGYLGTMILGAMLFNAGVSGLTAVGAMWSNYQAIV
jgi:high-affinity Fe2+/Pb2+ permease